jgi:hypothetical protein
VPQIDSTVLVKNINSTGHGQHCVYENQVKIGDLRSYRAIQTAPTRGMAPQSRPQTSPSTWRIQCNASSNWSCRKRRATSTKKETEERVSESAERAGGTSALPTLSHEASGSRYLASLEGSPCPFCVCDCFPGKVLDEEDLAFFTAMTSSLDSGGGSPGR